MRFITVFTGALFILGGVYLIANEGVTFLSVAFVVGLMFIIAGIIECLSHVGFRGEGEEKTWVLTEGLTTSVLGALIIMDKISAENVVPAVLGLWVIVSGIRNLVRAWDHIEQRDNFFYEHLAIGLLNFITGLYVFFDSEILNLTSIMLVSLCIIVQGMNLIHVGMTIKLVKPEFIKTKEEKVEEAAKRAELAHEAAREAVKAAKLAQAELKTVAETPAEEIDATLIPKPGENSQK